MTTLLREPLEPGPGDPWPAFVAQARAWAARHGVALRDAVVLLPFAQLLAPARRAWAVAGGWMPRIETTQTLARSLGPPPAPAPGQPTLDAALDRLAAQRLLRSAAGSSAWARRDPLGFAYAVDTVVRTTHALVRAAAAVPPGRRDAHWRDAREWLGAGLGPAGAERLLARLSLEWAATAAPATDGLHALQPAAWIVLQAGGSDPLTLGLVQGAGETPALVVDADVPLDEPFAPLAGRIDVAVGVCDDLEDEAQRAAAQVIAEVDAGHAPVALIAQDRLLVRRVRALLSRQRIVLQDETGWKLSTTRAAASVAGPLRAAGRAATTDTWVDWLKSAPAGWPGIDTPDAALQSLETALRRQRWVTPAAVDPARLHERAAALWHAARRALAPLAEPRVQPFDAWQRGLREALQASGAWAALQADDAGRQAIAALHLVPGSAAEPHDEPMTLDDFAAWVHAALEDASFVPEAPADAEVVITPLERAMLRPFASVVMPGADEKRLGGAGAPQPLLGDALAGALGVPTLAVRRDAETLAFAQLLRLPRVTLLRRRDDGGEPLAPSPLLERLGLALRRVGRTPAEAPDPRPLAQVGVEPVRRPRPAAPDLLPATLSASACDALRSCPYRFFALRMLRLRESPELDEDVEKSDYGTWLHAVLDRFHAGREGPASPDDEVARLLGVARALQAEMHLDDPSFLPYAASFARIAPRYVEWLHARDRHGARWLEGEKKLSAQPPAWGGTAMEGRIDRIDRVPSGEGIATQLIDYKTSASQKLRERVADAQEDTQLPFYAALVAAQPAAPAALRALYLPLDDADRIKEVEHPDVAASAERLVAGIGAELARLRDGASLLALGEGPACEWCEARGLCRRDHWSGDEEAAR